MKAWFDFLKKQEQRIGKEAAHRFLYSLKILSYDACNLYLEADNSFQLAFFKEHIKPLLKTEFLNNNFNPIKVHLVLKGEQVQYVKSTNKNKYSSRSANAREFPNRPALNFFSDSPAAASDFNNFVVSSQNELAFKLLLEISGQNPEKETFSPPQIFSPPFNPIYLYGPAETGKTHLLEALANILKQHSTNFFYVSANTFTEHVVSAMRFGLISQFREKYRSIDALLVDDIHILANKNATQEEFFHTFNALHMAGKLIVLTSRFSPSNLENIEDRLVSRFQWGIALNVNKIDQSGLVSFLSKTACQYALKLTNEAVSFLLKNFSSLNDLQKALQALALRVENKENDISFRQAEQLLGDLLSDQAKKSLTPDMVIEKIAYQFGLRKEDLLSKGQSKELSFPRQIAIYFLRQKLALTYQKIGSIFKRDHSTIMTSFKNIQKINSGKEEKLALLNKISTILEPK